MKLLKIIPSKMTKRKSERAQNIYIYILIIFANI